MQSAFECGTRSAERRARGAERGEQEALQSSADEKVPNKEAAQLRDTTRLLGDCGSYVVAPPYEHVYSALAVSALRSRPCGLGLAISALRSRPCGLGLVVSASRSRPCGLRLEVSASRSRSCDLGLALERGAHWSAECVGVRSALECEARWRAERVEVRSALECGARWSAERVGVLECGERLSAERV